MKNINKIDTANETQITLPLPQQRTARRIDAQRRSHSGDTQSPQEAVTAFSDISVHSSPFVVAERSQFRVSQSRSRRLPIAKYWFQRMRQIVDAAPDHLPATPTFPRFRKTAAPKPEQQSLSLAE